jgi:Mrp family chromosome partitioning ATPase
MTFVPARASALPMMAMAMAAAGRLARRMAQRGKARACTIAKDCVAFDPASESIEAIYQHTVASSSPIVGLTGVTTDSGVSSLARALARRASAGGQRSLLIDTSSRELAAGNARTPEQTADGYFHLTLRPAPEELLPLREVARLRKLFSGYMSAFDFIVIDMAPVIGGSAHPLPSTIVANACDSTMLVCMTGQMTNVDLQQALRNLGGANVKPCGIVANHREQPTLGAEIAREAERLRYFAPGFVSRVQKNVTSSKFLNVHA